MKDNRMYVALQAGGTKNAGTLHQYDYGQRLIFTGVTLPATYEVHFANSEKGASVTVLGDDTGVDIPDALLLTGDDIFVWVYLHTGEDDGETVYKCRIAVAGRAQITHEEPTPVQQDEITQLVAALNAAVEKCDANVEHYPVIDQGFWWVWDEDRQAFVNTGIPATGEKGDKGDTGDTGAQGEKGDKGDKGDPGLESVMVATQVTGNQYRLEIERV